MLDVALVETICKEAGVATKEVLAAASYFSQSEKYMTFKEAAGEVLKLLRTHSAANKTAAENAFELMNVLPFHKFAPGEYSWLAKMQWSLDNEIRYLMSCHYGYFLVPARLLMEEWFGKLTKTAPNQNQFLAKLESFVESDEDQIRLIVSKFKDGGITGFLNWVNPGRQGNDDTQKAIEAIAVTITIDVKTETK